MNPPNPLIPSAGPPRRLLQCLALAILAGMCGSTGSKPAGKHSVNVSRQGVVWLPGFARSEDEWLAQLPGLVADGSLALYEALLELED